MSRFPFVFALALLCVVGPHRAAAGEDDWELLERIPAWVTEPPPRDGVLQATDVGLSNRLELAYSPDHVKRERLNLRWQIERALRPLLGKAAAAPAIAGAKAATIVRKAYFHSGGTYSAFVLWETPLAGVLEAIPAAHRAASRAAVSDAPSAPSWSEATGAPAWVDAPPKRDGAFVSVAAETSSRADVARAVSLLRSDAHVVSAIRGKLRFHLGNRFAYDLAERAVSYGTVLERAWCAKPAKAWTLWSVPVDQILDGVPAASRKRVMTALGEPAPPRASAWQAVTEEPHWVMHPPQWPDHWPTVQTVVADHAKLARTQSVKTAETDVRRRLRDLLQPIVGLAAAERAASVGARRRAQAAHALTEGASPATAWTLWEVPLDRILEALDEKHRAAARAVLLP